MTTRYPPLERAEKGLQVSARAGTQGSATPIPRAKIHKHSFMVHNWQTKTS